MAENLPYTLQIGTLKKLLEKIKHAEVPERFSVDFLGETLSMKGGSAASQIPILKKMGFLDTGGVPTDRYRAFRNDSKSRSAVAEAVRALYAPIFKKNENAASLSKSELTGLIVECTGKKRDDRVTTAIVSTFELLKSMADFKAKGGDVPAESKPDGQANDERRLGAGGGSDEGVVLRLGYTINLHLPATKDVEVFNAIFKSLKEHLLRDLS